MNVIICGAGKVGFSISKQLAAQGHSITVIDQSSEDIKKINDTQDVKGIVGRATFPSVLENAGLAIPAVPPRYRATYFNHIMGGYSAGYYSYIWSEVLDADTVEWFKENGGLQRSNGSHFRETLLSLGGSRDAMQMYTDFRGRSAEILPLLERRGLL